MHIEECEQVLLACTLAVKSSVSRDGHGNCDMCSCAAVQNEVHVLSYCKDSLSGKKSLFLFLSASPFSEEPLIFCMPCLVRLSLISFLNGTTKSFISDLINIFLAGKDQKETDQPNEQAGGKP